MVAHQHPAHRRATLGRKTGIANVPQYIPRRIGEILRPPVLVAAALGGVLSLLWLRRRALLGALAGVLAVVVFAAFAAVGLPINTRYAFLASADPLHLRRRRRLRLDRTWRAATRGGAVVAAGARRARSRSSPTPPLSTSCAQRELGKLARHTNIEGRPARARPRPRHQPRCGPVGVPNHAPDPAARALSETSPRNIVSAQLGQIASGVYVDPASKEVEKDYVLDKRDPIEAVSVPPGFTEAHANRSWLIFQKCS